MNMPLALLRTAVPAVAALALLTSSACSSGGGRCSNGIVDNAETDVDCGGICGPCAGGQRCVLNGDCVTGDCVGGVCSAAAPTCDDGRKNGAETDVDCGGDTCRGCGVGQTCASGGDCVSGECEAGTCAMPVTCSDAELSPGETDVDCGGPCPGCGTDKSCREHWDCLSATCVFGVCKEPNCTDGVRNQGEPTVDCGGPCPGCALGDACFDGSDCASGACEAGVCCEANDCGFCGVAPAEVCDGVDNDCDGITDNPDVVGPAPTCELQAGVCGGAVARCAGADGWVCDEAVYSAHSNFYQPQELSCDGRDNDCDGQTDEGEHMPDQPLCSKQQGVCAGAATSCRGDAGNTCSDADYKAHNAAYEAVETLCDGIDNDCDGQTDEGLRNQCGECGVDPPELCDGVDNNCDGQTDETAACLPCKSAPVAITDVTLPKQTASSSWGGDAFRLANGQLCGFFRARGDNKDNHYDNRAVFYCMNGGAATIFHRVQDAVTGTNVDRRVAWAGPLGDDIVYVVEVSTLPAWTQAREFYRLTTSGSVTNITTSFPDRTDSHRHRFASSGANVYALASPGVGTQLSLTTYTAAGGATTQAITVSAEFNDVQLVVGQGASATPTVYYRDKDWSDYDALWRFWRAGSFFATYNGRHTRLDETVAIGADNTMHFVDASSSNAYPLVRHAGGQWASWDVASSQGLWYPTLALQPNGTPWLIMHHNTAGDEFRLYAVAQDQKDVLRSRRGYIGRAKRPTGVIVDDEPRLHVFFSDERGFWNNDVTPQIAQTWGYYMQICPGMSDAP